MRYYPVHLDLQDRPVLVVGGGPIAEGKARQLVDAGARVRVVSPELTEELQLLVDAGRIDRRAGEFRAADLDGVCLVISATDERKVNEEVSVESRARGIWCNVVDQPALCDFITPALILRGELQIGISTGGGSPVLAQRVKREIGELIGAEYEELLALAAEMRGEAKKLIPDFARRRDVLRAFVESEALGLLRAGRREEARQIAHGLLQEWREMHVATECERDRAAGA
jgi:precorrin-2 dehydrogenase/sirohydrochlorin ferrochelatase